MGVKTTIKQPEKLVYFSINGVCGRSREESILSWLTLSDFFSCWTPKEEGEEDKANTAII